MALYRDDALVLRLHKLGEADRIVTMLSRRNGKLRAVARGIAKTTSRIGARLEPFSHVDVQCYAPNAPRSSLHSVRQTEIITPFGKYLMGDYSRYTAACVIAETAERLSGDEGEPVPQLFGLTVGALRAMSGEEHTPSLVLDAYLLRAMSLAGWAPALIECAVCGSTGPHPAFSVQAGGAVCSGCRPAGSVSPSVETFALLVALQCGDWASADASCLSSQREASGLIAAHLQWHTERGLRSLPLVQRS
ncbi:MAG: DNA repair protein RecO [Mycobacteriales bacterium]